MAKTNFSRVLEERIQIEIKNRSESLAGGAALDYPSYRHQVGLIAGLQIALAVVSDIEREMDE